MKNRIKVILKFGSKSLVNDDRGLSESIAIIAKTADHLFSKGFFPIIVSSGAVRAGQRELEGIRTSSKNGRRYFSAIGQSKIVEEYASHLRALPNRLRTSQVLISRRTFANRDVYNDISNVIEEYALDGIIPIVNNNDFTYNQIHDFSDNDQLAAFLGIMTSSDHVVMFSDVDGIYEVNPNKHPTLKPIQIIEDLKEVRVDKSNISNGGIRSKIDSALILNEFGINHTVCTFSGIELLTDLFSGKTVLGSTFLADKSHARRGVQKWLRAGAIAEGIVVVSDKGTSAISAVSGRKSLLQSGIEAVYGDFVAGDVVSIRSADFQPLAVGITNYASWQLLEGIKSRPNVHKSTSHKDAVVSANYMAIKTREYFQNSDSHLVDRYILRYKSKLKLEATSDSNGKIEIYRFGQRVQQHQALGPAFAGDVGEAVGPRLGRSHVLVASLDLEYWNSHRDELSSRRKNLDIPSWSDFWIFHYALEGDFLGLPHWKRADSE